MGMSYGFATQLYEQAHARFLPLCSLDTRLQDVSETEKVDSGTVLFAVDSLILPGLT